jgi:hypothetical protein
LWNHETGSENQFALDARKTFSLHPGVHFGLIFRRTRETRASPQPSHPTRVSLSAPQLSASAMKQSSAPFI